MPSLGTADLVVIGGGVVGAATAFHAARAGIATTIVEARSALCTLTTPASTGAFRLQFDNLEELEVVRESAEVFLNFQETTEQTDYDLGIRQQGYLWVTTDEDRAEVQRDLVRRQHEWGQTDVELLTGDECRERFPYVTPDVVQARFRAGDGFLDPKALTMGLARGSGAEVILSSPVTGFVVDERGLAGVETARGTISTRAAVIAAGPLSGLVSALADIELPVHTVRRQKLVMPDVPEVPQDAPMTIDDDTGAHWRPALRGAYLLFTDPSTPPSDPTPDVPTDHSPFFELLDPASDVTVSRIAPFWREVWERNAAHWLVQAGQYTMTPDHRPLIGETSIPGLWINTGYSGHGIMASPAVSRRLVDLITGRRAQADEAFRPERDFVLTKLDLL